MITPKPWNNMFYPRAIYILESIRRKGDIHIVHYQGTFAVPPMIIQEKPMTRDTYQILMVIYFNQQTARPNHNFKH